MEQKFKGWTILIDADGCLTDGKKYVDATGQRQMIAFHSRDSIACKALVEMGFRVIVLTHSGFRGISEYWHKYGAFTFFAGGGDPMSNKLAVTSVHHCIDWEKTIGIGDDVTDICYLEKCKHKYAMADSHPHYRSKDLELWLGRSVYLTGNPLAPKRLPCNGGEGVLAYIYQLVQLGAYAND